MHMRHAAPLVLIAALGLTACGDKQDTAPSAGDTANAVALVNGQPIDRATFDEYMGMKQRMQPGMPLNPDVVLEELVNMELLEQAAEREGVHQQPDVVAQLDRQRANVLINTLLRDKLENMEFDQAKLDTAYQELLESIPGEEYHARHILVETEDDARALIVKLDDGADFADLARESSIGPSAPNGGDLGWFTGDMMVPEFSVAVESLDKRNYTREPVHTQFGWHVILLEDVRDTQKPEFAEVEEQLRNELQRNFIDDYLNELREAALIETRLDKPAPGSPDAE
ncbi:MAG TPA: peptidylprolyl isomerase [Thioalkalivibrio sp.]|nr:peptidylprolyl isomerase [Thioalkalivibrio sp.]